ncbi:MAG: Ig-like domain-containing protein, partial [bacterium]|nr:Ig-like domain-containing protein [bacterium]
MFKRVLLVVAGLLIIGGILKPVYGGERMLHGCEIGDALFGQVNFWGIPLPPGLARLGHAGLYYCSSTREEPKWDPRTDLVNSNMEFATIEAIYTVAKGATVQISKFTESFSNRYYSGAYNNGALTAGQRVDIVTRAYHQLGAKGTSPFPWIRKWPAIKDPNHANVGSRTFSCDGLVEYCYEQVIPGGFFNEEEEKDCVPKVKIIEIPEFIFLAKGKLPKFYPVALMKKMTKADYEKPEILEFKLEKDGKVLKPNDKLTGEVKLRLKTTDKNTGSGIDKVEFYYKHQLLYHYLPPTRITMIDTPDNQPEYTYDWNTGALPELIYEVYGIAYDRAGNKNYAWFYPNQAILKSKAKAEAEEILEPDSVIGPVTPIIIDHTPPQVVRTCPGNNDTKIYLAKHIRVTFSEGMGTETINEDTILVNNGAIIGSVTYSEDLRTAFFVPEEPLEINTNYNVLVKAGVNGVKDKAGNPLESDYSFSFTTTDELTPGRVIEVPVTYTDEYGQEHPVPAGTRIMSSYYLISNGQETYIVGPSKWQGVEEDGKVRFNWPGGNLNEQEFRVFFESQGYRTDWLLSSEEREERTENANRYASPSFWVFMNPVTNTQVHTYASWLFDIYKPEGSDVYVPVNGTITINWNEVVSIPWWSKVYYNRTGALHSLGAFNSGFDYMVTLCRQEIKPVDYASWMENLDFTPEGITCYGTNTLGKWRILVNGIKKDEWSEDKLLAGFGNLLLQRYGENYSHYNLLLRPKFNRRTDVFQAWVNGFSQYYSCLVRGTATVEIRDIDTGLTKTYNLESFGSETQGLDNEAAIAAALWKMKDPYNAWKAVGKHKAIITPAHNGYNVQDFWKELGTQSYIPMPEQTWIEHGLMPKIKYATSTNTPNPRLFWARNGILDNGIGVSWTLEVATESTFTNPVLFVKTQIAQENYHLTDINLEDGIYYWRVRVEDEYLPGNLQNALPELYSQRCSFEIHLPKQAGITVISDPNTQGIPSDVIVGIYDKEGSVYTGAYWVEHDQMNRINILDLRYTPITVHFEAQGGNAVVPPDYTFEEGSCVHIFENGIIFNEPGSYSITISISGEGINIPAASHGGIQVAPKGITPDHFHVVDILDPIDVGGTSNVSVVVHDANCNLVIGYTGSVYFTSTDMQSTLPQTYTFTAGDYGVNTFVDGVVLKTPGSQTVFAIDVNNPQITGSQTVTVEGTVTQTKIIITPTSGSVGSIVTVMGEGFGQTEAIEIDFGTTKTIALALTDAKGSFTTTFIVNTQPPGTTTVLAMGLSTNAEAIAYFKIIEDDTLPPTILHTPIIYAPAQLPMIIMATITDNIKVEQASLYWRIGGTKTIGEAQMVNMGNDRYLGTICAEDVTMRGLQYYLWATDGKNGTSSTTWITLTYGTVSSGKLGAVKPKWKSISVPIYPHNPDPANVLWNWGKFEKNVSLKYFDGTNWIIHN